MAESAKVPTYFPERFRCMGAASVVRTRSAVLSLENRMYPNAVWIPGPYIAVFATTRLRLYDFDANAIEFPNVPITPSYVLFSHHHIITVSHTECQVFDITVHGAPSITKITTRVVNANICAAQENYLYVIVGSTVKAFNILDGHPEREISLGGYASINSICTTKEYLAISNHRILHLYGITGGDKLLEIEFPPATAEPKICAGKAFFPSSMSTLIVVDLKTGQRIGEIELEFVAKSYPVICTSEDYVLAALNAEMRVISADHLGILWSYTCSPNYLIPTCYGIWKNTVAYGFNKQGGVHMHFVEILIKKSE